ncbi:hypothetical protein D9758_017015 [Tetrapyrgos nigripes]|uniref:Protein kinase domain-containing protein n=1 Tax=Tetrapyrgos nigripes TaxID=182062 RepID=A0A8H5BTX3_9AGAR|nr:hypothetical protein D9758_017015 [Tetrapyrgos nigripes]
MSDEGIAAHSPGRHRQVLKDTLTIFHSISPQDEEKLALLPLLELRGEEAQYRLDILQTIADSPQRLDQRVRFLTLKTIFRLSQESQQYPRCYVIKNLVLGKRIARGAYGVLREGKIAIGGESGTGIERPHRTDYAVKVVELFPDCVEINDCIREAVLWRQFRHPNVLPFLGMYYQDDKREDDKTPSQEDMYTLVHDIASGLKYLHDENVIHGDLKPDNVLITDHFRACLCDFGQSRLASTRGFQPTRYRVGGTHGYVAPEVTRDGRSSKEGDMYSFGPLSYEILKRTYNLPGLKWLSTNKVDTTRPEGLPSTPDLDSMWNMITQCLAKKPSVRPDVKNLISLLNDMSSKPKPAPDWDDTDPLFTQVRSNVDHGGMWPPSGHPTHGRSQSTENATFDSSFFSEQLSGHNVDHDEEEDKFDIDDSSPEAAAINALNDRDQQLGQEKTKEVVAEEQLHQMFTAPRRRSLIPSLIKHPPPVNHVFRR